MKKINIEFAEDPSQQDINIVITADKKDEEVMELIKKISDPFESTITVYDDKGSAIIIPLEKIYSISSNNRKLKVVSEDGVFEMRSSLQDIEQELKSPSFIKISRYEIINLLKVKEFDFSVSGTLRIEMNNGLETWASRRSISEIKKRLMRKENDQ
ncbi:MAG: LytTR family transcriptional regulator DNA-binding domain-containing protein [Erysipelotrichaceae bacterium]|nr:LytTR family transcriptional regulator DNA-binding domain-containing protein [Erysipelotrichaceae bacterium]